MKYVTQAIVSAGRPRGDCVRACIASILERDLEDVPHFVELQEQLGYHWMSLANGWLGTEKYNLQVVTRRMSNETIKLYYLRAPRYSPRSKRQWSKVGFSFDGDYIMSVDSKIFKGSGHAVVANDDRIVWDPSPRFGTPEYDRKPYVFHGWIDFFIPRDIAKCRLPPPNSPSSSGEKRLTSSDGSRLRPRKSTSP